MSHRYAKMIQWGKTVVFFLLTNGDVITEHPHKKKLNKIQPIHQPYGERNGNPLQYSCLENPMDRGAWRATVHGVRKSQTDTHTQISSKQIKD